jgi:hypothetical protein
LLDLFQLSLKSIEISIISFIYELMRTFNSKFYEL